MWPAVQHGLDARDLTVLDAVPFGHERDRGGGGGSLELKEHDDVAPLRDDLFHLEPRGDLQKLSEIGVRVTVG